MKHFALLVGALCFLFFAVNSCDRGEQPTESKLDEPAVGVEEPEGAMEAVEEEAEGAIEAVEEKAEEAVKAVEEKAEEAMEAVEEKAEEAVEGAAEKAKE